MTQHDIEARHVFVRGLVQGVSFRWNTCSVARDAGAVGWVRNLEDGRVEAHVQGSPAAVAHVLSWMRHGPRGARVEDLSVASAPVDETLKDFATRR